MAPLAGKVAIVTGGGRGLGRSHALELARLGASVVVNDLGVADFSGEGRAEDPASEVVTEIEGLGGRGIANSNDISDWDGAGELVEAALKAFGRLDIVVNNAAISRFGTIDQISRKDWESSMAVGLTGTAAMCHWAAAHWAASGPEGGRRIVNTASGVGLTPVVRNPMYVASKAGVAALTVACALELAHLGVKANSFAPVARTRISEFVAGNAVKAPAEGFDKMNPDNISPLVGYLASPACRFTGRTFGIVGSLLSIYDGWSVAQSFDNNSSRWTQETLEEVLKDVPLQSQTRSQSIPGVFVHSTPSDETLSTLSAFE